MRFEITCSQRGCVSEVEAEAAPELCPVCRNPLLEGNAVDVTEQRPVRLEGASLAESAEGQDGHQEEDGPQPATASEAHQVAEPEKSASASDQVDRGSFPTVRRPGRSR